jgi:hypothetical protein
MDGNYYYIEIVSDCLFGMFIALFSATQSDDISLLAFTFQNCCEGIKRNIK